jgi:hypothetical protein
MKIMNPRIYSVGIIQKGAVTHHHDQTITLHNFNVIKIKPKMVSV